MKKSSLFRKIVLFGFSTLFLFSLFACDENSTGEKYSIDDSSTTNLLSTGSSTTLIASNTYTVQFTVTSDGVGSTFKVVIDNGLNTSTNNAGSFTESPTDTYSITPTSAGTYSFTIDTTPFGGGSGNITFYVDGTVERVQSGFSYT